MVSFFNLLFALTRSELVTRYRGATFGFSWIILQPGIMFLIYYFVFGLVLDLRWGSSQDRGDEYPSILFCGLILFYFFSDVFNRAPSSILGNVNFVKKIYFPLEAVPLVVVSTALFYFISGLLLLLFYRLIFFGSLPASLLFVPLLLASFLLLLSGVALFVSSIGVYVRDFQHISQLISIVVLFTCPILYPSSMVPDDLLWVMKLNPLTSVVEQFRGAIIWATPPKLASLGKSFALNATVFLFGWVWFQKTRKYFGDIL